VGRFVSEALGDESVSHDSVIRRLRRSVGRFVSEALGDESVSHDSVIRRLRRRSPCPWWLL